MAHRINADTMSKIRHAFNTSIDTVQDAFDLIEHQWETIKNLRIELKQTTEALRNKGSAYPQEVKALREEIESLNEELEQAKSYGAAMFSQTRDYVNKAEAIQEDFKAAIRAITEMNKHTKAWLECSKDTGVWLCHVGSAEYPGVTPLDAVYCACPVEFGNILDAVARRMRSHE